MMRINRLMCLSAVVFLTAMIWIERGHAGEAIHKIVDKSLVRLKVEGTATLATPDGQFGVGDKVPALGTGFVIGDGGYILTTAHIFDRLKNTLAVDTEIKAEVSGVQEPVDVLYISELASLDLVLLRAFMPRGFEQPPALKIGHTQDIDLNDPPKFLTSGWDGSDESIPMKDELRFDTTSTQSVPYAWRLRGQAFGGQSGSPIYIDSDGEPLVVGVLKASSKQNSTVTLMIPIENSFQLIGHFKMREMQREIARLEGIIGETAEVPERTVTGKIGDVKGSIDRIWAALGPLTEELPERPLFDRVDYVEDSVNEIAGSFDWSAEADSEDGSLRIRYDKLIGGDPQIDKITVKIQTSMRVLDEDDKNSIFTGMTVRKRTIEKDPEQSDKRSGVFVLPDVQGRLTGFVEAFEGAIGGNDPYKDITVEILAKLPGTTSGSIEEKIVLVPKYNWNFDLN